MLNQVEIVRTLAEHNYEYVKKIGEGGNGSVHIVHSLRYGVDFCCKVRPAGKVRQDLLCLGAKEEGKPTGNANQDNFSQINGMAHNIDSISPLAPLPNLYKPSNPSNPEIHQNNSYTSNLNIQNIQPTNCENNSTISTPNNNNPQTRNQIQHSNSNDMKPMCYQFLQNYANNPLNQGKNEREQQANGLEIVLNGQKIVLNSQNNNNQNSPLQPNNNSNQNNINRNLNMFSNANNDASNIPSEIDLAKKEGEIGANLKVRHPNIISLFEYFEKDGTVFIIIEYCPNGSLNDYIKKNGPMKPPMLYSFCYQILGALNACHNKKVAHRDIKPSNILIDQHGRPKICDFGLSLDLENSIDKKITSRGGSLYWMAPEIFDPNVKNNGFDPFKADVWALGVTFYQMAMGKLPWIISGSDHREHQQEVIKSIKFGLVHFDIDPDHPRRTAPIEFQKLINQMLKTSPKFRPTIEQVLSDKIFNDMQQPQIASSGSMRGSFSRMAMASGRGIDPSGSRRSGMKAGFFVQSFSDKSISHKRRHLSKPDQSALKLVSGNRSFAQENRRQSTFA